MSTKNTKRIAKNTLVLYIRMLFVMGVSLYTSRIVLQVLGFEDFGIYNVVGGVCIMFSFINNSMSGATSRFLTYELGKQDNVMLKKVFQAALTVHIAIALILIVFSETGGLWFVVNKLVIPDGRMRAALTVYQLSILGSIISIIRVPFNALIIAHERMSIYAFTGIFEALFKLVMVYFLSTTSGDKLIIYAGIILSIGIILTCYIWYYCLKTFPESRTFVISKDKNIINPMLSFSAWELYGSFCVLMRTEGINILMNIFFGPAINAANAIAVQVQSATAGFADNFLTAIRPQIVKQYAAKSIEEMQKLMFYTSKYGFLLLYMVSLPLIIENKKVLELWLHNVPDFAVEFCQLILINNLISIVFRPFMYAVHATGKIKGISLVNGSIYVLVVPLSYIFFKNGATPIVPFLINILLLLIGSFFNVWRAQHYITGLAVNSFFQNFIKKVSPVVCFSMLLSLLTSKLTITFSFVHICLVTFVSSITIVISTFIFSFDSDERVAIYNYIKKKVNLNG